MTRRKLTKRQLRLLRKADKASRHGEIWFFPDLYKTELWLCRKLWQRGYLDRYRFETYRVTAKGYAALAGK